METNKQTKVGTLTQPLPSDVKNCLLTQQNYCHIWPPLLQDTFYSKDSSFKSLCNAIRAKNQTHLIPQVKRFCHFYHQGRSRHHKYKFIPRLTFFFLRGRGGIPPEHFVPPLSIFMKGSNRSLVFLFQISTRACPSMPPLSQICHPLAICLKIQI